MPNCDNCDSKFPNTIKINGILKNLSSRRYCLDCSPWGKHNTKAFDYIKKETQEKECVICNKPYKTTGEICDSCYVSCRRFARKLKAIEYLGGSCRSCGYAECPAALAFHHKDPSKKEFNITGNSRSWNKILIELDKCVLLCHNCHYKLHWEEGNEKRKIMLERINKYTKHGIADMTGIDGIK